MYSTYNEGKSVVAERFIRTLKNKIFKHMTAISKNFYFDVLDDIVKKYNNTIHRTIKMKPIEVTGDYYVKSNGIAFNKDSIELHSIKLHSNKKDSKFQVSDHVRISKYKNIFANEYTRNWSEEAFAISKIKNPVRWTYVINDLNGEEITGNFSEKEL